MVYLYIDIANNNIIVYNHGMDIRKLIDMEKIKRGIRTDAELARLLNWNPANYADRVKRDAWKVKDLEKVADALDCDLVITFEPREK